MDEQQLAQCYTHEFFSGGSYADYVADKPVLQRNFSRFIGVIRPHAPHGRLFEIGCAYGFFLELAQRYWDVEGVDISQEATTYARREIGLHVTCGDFLELPLEADAYDLVVMWDTIEHLCDPAAHLAKIRHILKPGGVLALTTGDVGSLAARIQGRGWRLYYPPHHLHYFSRRTLRSLLARQGLEMVTLQAVGFYRSFEMMLNRLLFDRKPVWLQRLYRAARRLRLAGRRAVYLNLFDIMLVIARKPLVNGRP
jgi:SAM-dependent methyltransferase